MMCSIWFWFLRVFYSLCLQIVCLTNYFHCTILRSTIIINQTVGCIADRKWTKPLYDWFSECFAQKPSSNEFVTRFFYSFNYNIALLGWFIRNDAMIHAQFRVWRKTATEPLNNSLLRAHFNSSSRLILLIFSLIFLFFSTNL